MKNKARMVLAVASTVWCSTIIAAPLLGSSWIYAFFSAICHQDPARSWHLNGEPLPVCMRCTSIYLSFTLSAWLQLTPNQRWLRTSLMFMLCEFALAHLLIDVALLRCLSGILVGLSAAPFVKQGLEEMR